MTGVPDVAVERPYGDPPQLDAKPDYKVAIKRAGAKFSQDQCTDLAASLTYYSVQALVPALIAVISTLGLFGDGKKTTDDVISTMAKMGGVKESKLSGVSGFIDGLQTSSGAGAAFALGILLSLWSASGYVGAFARMSNRIYDVAEGRPAWKLRPWLYLITIVSFVFGIVAVLALVVSGPVATKIGNAMHVGGTAVTVWNWLKLPFVLVIVIMIISLLYWGTPNVKRPFKDAAFNPGAVLAFFIWAIGSALFAWYVTNMGSYGKYGQLSTVIILLLWLWISNLAMLFGAEFDAELLRTRQLKSGYPAEELILLPARDESGIEKKAEKYDKLVAAAHELREESGVPNSAVASMLPVAPGVRSDERTMAAQSGSSEVRPATPQAKTVERAPKLAAATKDEAPNLAHKHRFGASKPAQGTSEGHMNTRTDIDRERAEIEADREARRRRAIVEAEHQREVRTRIAQQEAKASEAAKKAEEERIAEEKKREAERPLEEQWAEVEHVRARYDHPDTREYRAVEAERAERRRRWFAGRK